RPMRFEDLYNWDLDKAGLRARVLFMCVCAQERVYGGGLRLEEKTGKRVLFGCKGLGVWHFWSLGFIIVGKLSLDVKGLRILQNWSSRFSESTPNVVGSGPDWLFNIDALTRTMNYEPIIAGTQSNSFAGTKASDNVGQARKEPEYVNEDLRKENECKDQQKNDNVNNANNVNIVNAGGTNEDNELLFDLNMLALEGVSIFNLSRDDKDDDAIEEEGYVCQPPGFEDPDFLDRVYKVEKALYRLHQASRAWHKGDILLVQVYVDDIIFGSTKKELCNAFERLMHEKFQMSSMGELTFFLGLQSRYLLVKKFGFIEVKTASTPMETQKPLLKDEDDEEVDVHMCRSMIGSLMYFTSSRPDIMFAVYACAIYQVNPKVSYLYAVKKNFRYLKGQPKLGPWYPKDFPFDLVAYTDSDYAGASLDRKSTTGGITYYCWLKVNAARHNLLLLFWSTAMAKTINGEVQIHVRVDGKEIVITESSIRSDLQLADEEGIDCFPNSTIFEHLALMGLEPGTFTSIFKFSALKQLAIKRWDVYGFVIRPGLVGVTYESVRIDL
nr:hypothetical protein [Tanacetum cinerariifolium]